jgi:hypothetical protein
MTPTPNPPPPHLGFLTVVQDGGGSLGGYLVTNLWGRPLEFRLSTAVVPNRVQQILYGPTLGVYLAADLIGKTLVEKTATPAGLILTDTREALELRRSVEVPVVWVAPAGNSEAAALAAAGLAVRDAGPGRGPVLAHPDFAADVEACVELFGRLAGLDVAEPFARIREAVAEARKMGVTQRAA